MLRDASRDGVRSLVVRANDFIGANAPSSWFGTAMVKPGKPLRSITYPGRAEIGHGFAYLPDMAETIARLAEIEDRLADFEIVHFGGHWFDRGADFTDAVGRAAGIDRIKVRRFPWFVIFLAPSGLGPRAPACGRCAICGAKQLRLDNRKLVSLIGTEPHTPIEAMLRATLEPAMGCLPAASNAPVMKQIATA